MTCEKINVRHKITLKPVYITQIKQNSKQWRVCQESHRVPPWTKKASDVPVMSWRSNAVSQTYGKDKLQIEFYYKSVYG